MSTKAQAILEEIKALPPDEQEQVRDGIRQLEERQRQWEAQKTKLREMQARHAGSGLLNRLLEERAKERARG
jgi:Arc/MetJ-type ribon-helix-helix transcriptional regulator